MFQNFKLVPSKSINRNI